MENFLRQFDARRYNAAQVFAAIVYDVEGRRRAEINHNQGAAMFFESGCRIAEAIRSDRSWIPVMNLDGRRGIRPDFVGNNAETVLHHVGEDRGHIRHHRTDCHPGDPVDVNIFRLAERLKNDPGFIRRARDGRCQPPVIG